MRRKTNADPLSPSETVAGRSLAREIVHRFKKNRLGMFAFAVLAFLFSVAIGTTLCDLFTDNAYYDKLVVGQDLMLKLQAPNFNSVGDLFGRDEYGRSVFYRVVWGTRYSIFMGVTVIAMATLAGGCIGSVAGYYGGKIDNFIMRCMDILLAIPYILFAIAIVASLGTSTINLMIAMTIPKIPHMARVVRASVMTVKDREYIEAGRAMGASDFKIISKYIIPNAASPIIVQATLGIAQSILGIAGLSYLGLGVQPPTPEWGSMLVSAKIFLRDAWHITVIPGVVIIIAVMAFNIFGDAIRDALDPKQKGGRRRK